MPHRFIDVSRAVIASAHVIVYSRDADADRKFFRDTLDATIETLNAEGVECTTPTKEGWGGLTMIALPGGGQLGLYETAASARDGFVKVL